MASLLLAVIYLAFISLGLPDSLLGAGWPVMHGFLGVPLSYAGFVSMLRLWLLQKKGLSRMGAARPSFMQTTAIPKR